MYPECFPKHGHVVLDKLKNTVASERFVLAGGTALALKSDTGFPKTSTFHGKTFSTDKVFQRLNAPDLPPRYYRKKKARLS